ncbi:GNAT family N-acetyltransferase [Octadecabacter sp.]|nr:GNAT family N-acetyltransferase [Octadecabacter sp.]
MLIENLKVSDLSDTMTDCLYNLMKVTYEGVTYHDFVNDLLSKDTVFIIRNEGKIIGFSSLARRGALDKELEFFFSGDTMILPEYWGKANLHFAIKRFIQNTASKRKIYVLASMHPRTYFIIKNIFRNEVAPTITPRNNSVLSYGKIADLFIKCFPEIELIATHSTEEYLFTISKYSLQRDVLEFQNAYSSRLGKLYQNINPRYAEKFEVISFHLADDSRDELQNS